MRSWGYQINQTRLREQLNVQIVDDFMKDPVFAAKVQNDSLLRSCDKVTGAGIIRFWYYPVNEPANIFEELVVIIYKDTDNWD